MDKNIPVVGIHDDKPIVLGLIEEFKLAGVSLILFDFYGAHVTSPGANAILAPRIRHFGWRLVYICILVSFPGGVIPKKVWILVVIVVLIVVIVVVHLLVLIVRMLVMLLIIVIVHIFMLLLLICWLSSRVENISIRTLLHIL